ncbi:MAG: RluA family pseudouridine synthase, partial [Chloroflexota bacterium]|nr:RluA family pseudouridine synthase [Chloroflexota bacterium]
ASGVPPRMADEPTSTERVFVVPEDGDRRRVDRFVADVSGLSRSFVQKLIVEGRLTAGGTPIKANAVIGPGDRLVLDVPAVVPLDVAGEAIPLEVVYEDDDLLIVDKPAGLVVHPSPGHSSGTLVNALLGRAGGAEYGGIAGVSRPGIVHRLDRDTSGLLMVAKHDAAQAGLMASSRHAASRRPTWPWSRAASRPTPGESRPRSGAIQSTGPGWRWCPMDDRRSPATGSRSGCPAGRCSSWTW